MNLWQIWIYTYIYVACACEWVGDGVCVCVYVCLSICLFVCLSVCLLACMPYLCIGVSAWLHAYERFLSVCEGVLCMLAAICRIHKHVTRVCWHSAVPGYFDLRFWTNEPSFASMCATWMCRTKTYATAKHMQPKQNGPNPHRQMLALKSLSVGNIHSRASVCVCLCVFVTPCRYVRALHAYIYIYIYIYIYVRTWHINACLWHKP